MIMKVVKIMAVDQIAFLSLSIPNFDALTHVLFSCQEDDSMANEERGMQIETIVH